MSERTVALIGLRCSGKSSVGRRLAALLARPFVDLDEELAHLHAREHPEEEPASAGGLLERLGTPGFRDLEERALAGVLAAPRPIVLATGGGVVERAPCRELLSTRCTCVWLRAEPELLRRRMAADEVARPSLTGAGAVQEVEQLARRRAPLYAGLARFRVDAGAAGPDAIARRVRELLHPEPP